MGGTFSGPAWSCVLNKQHQTRPHFLHPMGEELGDSRTALHSCRVWWGEGTDTLQGAGFCARSFSSLAVVEGDAALLDAGVRLSVLRDLASCIGSPLGGTNLPFNRGCRAWPPSDQRNANIHISTNGLFKAI